MDPVEAMLKEALEQGDLKKKGDRVVAAFDAEFGDADGTDALNALLSISGFLIAKYLLKATGEENRASQTTLAALCISAKYLVQMLEQRLLDGLTRTINDYLAAQRKKGE